MGAGAWGTALAKVLADAGNNVTLWARHHEVADEINDTRRNTGYLDDVDLPKSIRATGDPAEALSGACTVLLAVPSQTMRANLEQWKYLIADEQPAATVVACSDSGRAVALQRALATGYFRPYTNADVIGAEVGGACKNVIALACGM